MGVCIGPTKAKIKKAIICYECKRALASDDKAVSIVDGDGYSMEICLNCLRAVITEPPRRKAY